jgi:hypothetical protein
MSGHGLQNRAIGFKKKEKKKKRKKEKKKKRKNKILEYGN